jgi:D-sedoheptulose 7-phosphate isomerase
MSERDAAVILGEAARSMGAVASVAAAVDVAAAACARAIRSGGQVFFCGNGGSAADAQHLAGEFLGRFLKERAAWASTALSANIAAITAIANDYAYEDIFARQLQGLGRRGDVIIGLSTSGGSANVLKALRSGREMGIYSIGLTGAKACPMDEIADLTIHAHATATPRIQEMHLAIGHTICEIVETALAGA